MWNYAFKSYKYIHSEDNVYKELDDISVLTKKRAMIEYGLLVSKHSKQFYNYSNYRFSSYIFVYLISFFT